MGLCLFCWCVSVFDFWVVRCSGLGFRVGVWFVCLGVSAFLFYCYYQVVGWFGVLCFCLGGIWVGLFVGFCFVVLAVTGWWFGLRFMFWFVCCLVVVFR